MSRVSRRAVVATAATVPALSLPAFPDTSVAGIGPAVRGVTVRPGLGPFWSAFQAYRKAERAYWYPSGPLKDGELDAEAAAYDLAVAGLVSAPTKGASPALALLEALHVRLFYHNADTGSRGQPGDHLPPAAASDTMSGESADRRFLEAAIRALRA